MAELLGGALMPRAAALARPDGSVTLVCGDPSPTAELVEGLVERGHVLLADETTLLDPETLEVQPVTETSVPAEPLEVRLLVVPHPDVDTKGVVTTRLPGGEAAHLVGSRCVRLDEVSGGPLHALARLARRVPAYHIQYADHRLVAPEVVRLWREL